MSTKGCLAAYAPSRGDYQEKPPTIGIYPGKSSGESVVRRQSAAPLLCCPIRAATSIAHLAGLTGTIGEPNYERDTRSQNHDAGGQPQGSYDPHQGEIDMETRPEVDSTLRQGSEPVTG